jgi:hypothetical protein
MIYVLKETSEKGCGLFAIAEGEEVTHDYTANAVDQFDGQGFWVLECHCGSKNCRGRVTGDFFEMPQEWQYYDHPDEPFEGISREVFERRNREHRQRSEEPLPDSYGWHVDTVEGRHIGWVNYYQLDREAQRAYVSICLPEEETWSKCYGTEAKRFWLTTSSARWGSRRCARPPGPATTAWCAAPRRAVSWRSPRCRTGPRLRFAASPWSGSSSLSHAQRGRPQNGAGRSLLRRAFHRGGARKCDG